MKIKQKYFIKQSFIISIIFLLIYYIILNPNLNGIVSESLLDNYLFIGSILLLSTIKISFHLIRIKLIFWRIFLQTFLNTSSKIYKFFAHGYMVRLIAFILSLGLSIKILIFFCLIPIHFSQFIILYCGLLLFTVFKINEIYGKSISFIREDIGIILKVYLTAFLLATFTGICVSIWEICHLEGLKSLDPVEIMELTAIDIDPNNNIFLRILRIVIRHLYAYELLIQQLVHFDLGKPLYFLYLVISEGSVTFFGIYLLTIPIKLNGKENEKD